MKNKNSNLPNKALFVFYFSKFFNKSNFKFKPILLSNQSRYGKIENNYLNNILTLAIKIIYSIIKIIANNK